MKKPLYKRELSHSYLVMEEIPEELSRHYQYRMILRNRIPGLLASSERYLEGKACLYYDISSRQSLEQLYLSAKIGMKEIRGIIDNLVQVLDSMSEYLLEERFLILAPEYIYMDLETEQLFFLYYPFQEEKEAETRYLPMAEFFLEHVDHREEKAVSAAYQFYKMSRMESFMVGSFRTCLEKEMHSERAQKAGLTDMVGEEGRERDDRPAEAADVEYGCEKPRLEGRRHTYCFCEEEGPYEYRDSADGGRADPETVSRSTEKAVADRKREDRRENRKNMRRKAAAFLAVSVMVFFLFCAAIWYLRPEGGKKIAMFGFLAADGLFLLICLWKTVAEAPEEAIETEPEEKISEGGIPFWEEYMPQGHEELEGPTVYLSRSGVTSGCAEDHRRPRLTGTSEEADEKRPEYSLERLPVLVGKLRSRAQILLPDASVSRIHARFVEREGKTALIDLNSTNGTFVNDVRLEQEEVAVLEAGDELRFGNVRMKYEE